MSDQEKSTFQKYTKSLKFRKSPEFPSNNLPEDTRSPLEIAGELILKEESNSDPGNLDQLPTEEEYKIPKTIEELRHMLNCHYTDGSYDEDLEKLIIKKLGLYSD